MSTKKVGGFFEFSRILTHSFPANPTTAPIAVSLAPLWELRSRLNRLEKWTSTAGNWTLRVVVFFVVEVFLFDSTFIALRKVSLFFGSWVRNTGGDDWNESSEEMWFARGAPIRILQFVVYCCVFTLNHSDIHVYCWKSNINYNLSARF